MFTSSLLLSPSQRSPGIREWFRWYKTPDLKPLNAFGFDERVLSKKEALEVIEETHGYWKALKAGTTDKGSLWLG